jgi:hypothetical protein
MTYTQHPPETAAPPTAESLARIAEALERVAAAMESRPKAAPDLNYPLSDYPHFNWAAIGAEVVASDRHGATAVKQGGKIYTRRNPVNKFGVAIWYSRAVGKDGDETLYERLITFRETKRVEADPLNEKTLAILRQFV